MLKLIDSWVEPVAMDIEQILWKDIFEPIYKLLDEPVYNSKSILISRIRAGKIIYQDGEFLGDFNIASSKALSAFAKFDSRSGTWKGLAPPDVLVAAIAANEKSKKLAQDIDRGLDDLNKRLSKSSELFHFPIGGPIDSMDSKLEKEFSDLGIKINLTPQMKKNLTEDYNKNQSLSIQGWKTEQIERLRGIVSSEIIGGLRRKDLIDMIASEWGVSKNKAIFLARQETSLLMSKLRRERSIDAGVTKYRWSTSQDARVRPANPSQKRSGADHRHLHGTIQIYGKPPIVNLKTGKRAEPGEDYNCRCVAIAII